VEYKKGGENMATDGLIMRCIKGEEWPVANFQSFVNTDLKSFSEENVIFHCPKGHKFTLKEALLKGILTKEWAEKIMVAAKKLYNDYKTDLKTHRPDNYLVDKETEKRNIPCDGCEKKAQKPFFDKFLCLECTAAFDNYLEKYFENEGVWEIFYNHWGTPIDLLRNKIFDRFMDSQPALNKEQMEKLYEECKKEVRKIRRRFTNE